MRAEANSSSANKAGPFEQLMKAQYPEIFQLTDYWQTACQCTIERRSAALRECCVPGHLLQAIVGAGSDRVHGTQRVPVVGICQAQHAERLRASLHLLRILHACQQVRPVCQKLAEGHLQRHLNGCGPARHKHTLDSVLLPACPAWLPGSCRRQLSSAPLQWPWSCTAQAHHQSLKYCQSISEARTNVLQDLIVEQASLSTLHRLAFSMAVRRDRCHRSLSPVKGALHVCQAYLRMNPMHRCTINHATYNR